MKGKQISRLLLPVLVLVLQCYLTAEAAGIKIAAYNVRIFGRSKLQNQVAMNMITQVSYLKIINFNSNYDQMYKVRHFHV